MQEFLNKLKENGIPVIVLQDPISKKPSTSFTVFVISTVLVCAGILSNWLSFLKGVDVNSALTFFGLSAGLYFSRRFNINGKSVGVEKE